ncbi:helix-turn-helix domain-containing protein [Streptomyces sp. NPDC006997]|uniref:TetR/AcrR family transcriptional regulator n=1 Tax=Streptomyces sp. NPDC006997 TaxID=3155356 RepID=UPI0033CD6990
MFWSRGYGATSIQDLVDTLAVERGSLYGTFGDKRRCSLDAVRLYREVYERHLVAALDTAPLCWPGCAGSSPVPRAWTS